MSNLTPRQIEIMTLVIESHIATHLPVGSRTLSKQHGLPLSPASVRHEMGILEERGYLTHPHTSAGRVPTDKGYHFYVKEVVREEPVSEELINFISREMEGKIENLESLMERASHILSAMAQEAVLVTSPELQQLYFKELNLVRLDATRLLAMWCTTSGLVQNCLVVFEEAIASEEVERIRNLINEALAGEPIERLEEKLLARIESRRDSLRRLYQRTLKIIRESLPHWTMPRVFVEGSRYILNQPEFHDLKKFQLLMELLEEKASLIDLLMSRSLQEGVHVAIGEKELSKNIWDCALISAPYVWRGKHVGAVGVLGPRRMPYGRIMGLVHRMAEGISQSLVRWGS